MQHIDPFSLQSAALLPCNVYPFIAGNGSHSYARARTNLKVCCLLHEHLHLPGSLALQDPFVQALTAEMMPFIDAGHVLLDLRSSCSSFTALAQLKFGAKASPSVQAMASLLDEHCATVLSFDATGTATQYASHLLQVIQALRDRARGPAIVEALDAAAQQVMAHSATITLEDAMGLMKQTHLDGRFRAIAKLLYSLEGAKVTNSDPIIPLSLWSTAFPAGRPALWSGTMSGPLRANADRKFANDVVMDYFSINALQIDRLDAKTILEIKREPLTARYIRELDAAVDEVSSTLKHGERIDDALAMAQDRSELIRQAVQRRCEREYRRGKKEAWVLGTVFEVGGWAGDLMGVGPVARGLASLARTVARKYPPLSWLDYTSAPLATHVARFQGAVVERRADTRRRP